MNPWFNRYQTKSDLTETLMFCGIQRESSEKKNGHYSIPTDIGQIDIYSSRDIRINGSKVGSFEMFKQHLAMLHKRGLL